MNQCSSRFPGVKRATQLRKRIGLVLALSGVLSLPTGAQESADSHAERPAPTRIHRLALLLSRTALDPQTQMLIRAERAQHNRRRRGSGLPRPGASPTPAEKAAERAERIADAATPEQLRGVGEALFFDSLARKMSGKADITVLPDTEVNAALTALKLSPSVAENAASARRLCAYLHCEALIAPASVTVELHEEKTRIVIVRVALRILRPSAAPGEVAPGENNPPLPAPLEAAGAALTGRRPFQFADPRKPPKYVDTRVRIVWEAAERAAAHAAYTLRTGKIVPLQQQKERLAFVPTLAPEHGDKLRFTPQGRRLQPEALSDLPSDVSDLFTPDLLPLLPPALVLPESVREALRQEGVSAAMLWAQDGLPDITRLRALGSRLHVDYVLAAHVTNIELEEGPPDPSTQRPDTAPQREREARATAYGTLLRVQDGAQLWQDWTTATMTAHTPQSDGALPPDSDRQLARQATRFALVDLERRFRHYRESFQP